MIRWHVMQKAAGPRGNINTEVHVYLADEYQLGQRACHLLAATKA